MGALDALIALAFWTVGGLRDPWIPLFVVAGFVVFVVFSELGRARNRSVRP